MIVDTDVYLSRWPFRRLAGDEPADLVVGLRKRQVTQAWVGSFDGLLHKDIGGVNARLAEDCRKYGADLLLPFGSVNPALPEWQEDLRRCHEIHHMAGIRLHPNYHGYTLANPVFREVLSQAARRGLVVQIVLCMEDDRTQHPLLRVPPVDGAPLADLIRATPHLRLQVLNCRSYYMLSLEQLRQISVSGEVYFDFAMTEGVFGLERLIENVSLDRVAFGSHTPLFYFESVLLKIREAGLMGAQVQAVSEGNARRLLGKQSGSSP